MSTVCVRGTAGGFFTPDLLVSVNKIGKMRSNYEFITHDHISLPAAGRLLMLPARMHAKYIPFLF